MKPMKILNLILMRMIYIRFDNMSIDDKKENIEWRKSEFECELENTYEIENQNGMTCIHEKK